MQDFGERAQGEVVCRIDFPELRRCRSELHTSRGRKRKLRIIEPPLKRGCPTRSACRANTAYGTGGQAHGLGHGHSRRAQEF
jgi:hypothetical protein